MKTTAIAAMLTLGALALPTVTASAQVVLSGDSYVQTFDQLGSGLPPGWSVRTGGATNQLGAVTECNTNTTSWGKTTGQFANYASVLGNEGTNLLGDESRDLQAACTNRCLGVRQTGSFGDPGAAFVLQLQNTLGLADFQLKLDCNLLSAQSRSTTWILDYAVGNDPTNFVTLGNFEDPGGFGATAKSFSFGSGLDNQSNTVWIRIVALDNSTGSHSRDTFAIDNVVLNYTAASATPAVPLHIRLKGDDAILDWKNSSAYSLQTAPSAGGTYTNVPDAASPYTNAISRSQQFFRLQMN